jgi:Arc/MetJ-type ribon-helix-helix transcriptional regulator
MTAVVEEKRGRNRKNNKDAVILTLRLPQALLQRMDALIDEGVFQNRGELIREAIRRIIIEYDKKAVNIPG